MKAILTLIIISTILVPNTVTCGFGQSAPQPMWVSSVLIDPDCSLGLTICGTDGTGCTSMAVTVPVTGPYALCAWIECNPSDPDCGGCYACAHLMNGNVDVFGSGVQTLCTSPCDGRVGPVQLVAGVQYKLIVCKRPCNNLNCEACSAGCVAKAQVRGA
jgi:hypothetical protein